MGPTHAAAGMLAAEIVLGASHAPPIYWPIGIALGAVAGIIPDIDHPSSFLNQRLPLGSTAGMALNHRHFTHSIVATILFSLYLRWLWPMVPEVLINAAVAGYFSHVLIDPLNPEGDQLLWPLPWMFSFSRILPYPLTFSTEDRMEIVIFRNALWLMVILTVVRPTLI
ncbi:metal-dependent hydrolase [Desulfosporosinus shakirovi]|uniref:metal-dependent hydrolase n=1 Tax=Desulfosporosinus shakirovi TaxID=2885154 RepID=UPI001E62CD39|nr:metal-dependent hydrolase [Desulfosporosinus sp. SRJS8]MCB8818613.1 metal-dependent hydrolase [Desulfosporosinus sp. SRJS8]